MNNECPHKWTPHYPYTTLSGAAAWAKHCTGCRARTVSISRYSDGTTRCRPLRALVAGKWLKRKVLRTYAYYRRNSFFPRTSDKFSYAHLVAFHLYESTGQLPVGVASFTAFSMSNGYANGKWIAKLNADMIAVDLQQSDPRLYGTPTGISIRELCAQGATKWWWRNMYPKFRDAPLALTATELSGVYPLTWPLVQTQSTLSSS